jgi:hypothetical protein
MPSIQERVVATGRGVRAERDLAEAAADFYVLELLTAREDAGAAKRLATLEGSLAREFSCYLDMAIGGELRYAMQHLGKEALPADLACFFREIEPGERGMAWMAWNVVRRVLGLRALELATEVFRTPGWAENFGGDAWSLVARLLRDHLRGRVIARVSSTSASAWNTTPEACSTSSTRPKRSPASWTPSTTTTTRRSCDTRRKRSGRAGGSSSGDGARSTIPPGSASR